MVQKLTLSLLVLVMPLAFGQTTSEVSPSAVVCLTGSTVLVEVDVDPSPGSPVGSYGASLGWDPGTLQFVGASGGDEPFDSPVVDITDVAFGSLSFADAAPAGVDHRVSVLGAVFQCLVDPPAATALDLEFTSLFAAETFEDLLPEAEIEDGYACVSDYFYDLRASGSAGTLLDWMPVPGALSYDVVRGVVSGLSLTPMEVRLGEVACLENDSLDTTTGAGTEPANPDMETPLPRESFFYVVRHRDGAQDSTYGFFSDCLRERIADAGDCP